MATHSQRVDWHRFDSLTSNSLTRWANETQEKCISVVEDRPSLFRVAQRAPGIYGFRSFLEPQYRLAPPAGLEAFHLARAQNVTTSPVVASVCFSHFLDRVGEINSPTPFCGDGSGGRLGVAAASGTSEKPGTLRR